MCNGTAISNQIERLAVVGDTISSSLTITNSALDIELSAVNIAGRPPVNIQGSNVRIRLVGKNSLTSDTDDRTGIECSGWSNISFLDASGVMSLTVRGGEAAVGIKTKAARSSTVQCGLVEIANRSSMVSHR
jgi:hypothetical protein